MKAGTGQWAHQVYTKAMEKRHLVKIGRRRFLQLTTAVLLHFATSNRRMSAAGYRVGVGKESDAYVATKRAINASGDWSSEAIAGRKLIIKPNLVIRARAETGITTDPEVVRAIVDMALAAGAAEVMIIEGGPEGANFSACGYDFFEDYDGAGRVSLGDLSSQSNRLADVSGGLAYRQIYMPELLFGADTFLISVGKMKCHAESLVTLSMKNLFGLPPFDRYIVPPKLGRFAMHDRGVHQSIVDLNLARPVDFAVVDGIWAMEGNGPWGGTPVRLNMVIAGSNALAVDRVCLVAMGIPQHRVQHVAYAANRGLGPADTASIEMRGDSFTSRAFLQPDIPPMVDYPRADPNPFNPGNGQGTAITYGVNRLCWTQVEIIRTSETSPEVTRVRLLKDWAVRPAGFETLVWDGRDDEGQVVSPGSYTIRVQATHGEIARNAFATGWLTVSGDEPRHTTYLPFVLR